jgi:hypothetical protein
MTTKLVLAIAGLLTLSAMIPVSLLAHHSFAAEFDDTKPVKLQGTVTKVEWMNPHIWFYIDVKTSGNTVNWQCEAGNPNSLVRQGWSRNTLKPGMTVELEGWRARDGGNTCNTRAVTTNGKRLFAGTSNPNAQP